MPIDWATFGVDLHLELDASGGRRAGLERALREAIRTGRLAAGSRLPSSRALATELGIARNTVGAAYDQLVAEGYLSARSGSGTTVAALPPAGPVPATQPVVDQPRYDLRPGTPDPTTFPVAAWLRATRRALAAAPASAYGYGDPRGRVELRTALAGYLGRARGVLAHPDRIVVVSGYVQALALLTTALRAGAAVDIAMEDPGLAFHRDIATHAGARVMPLPVDERGARTDLLSTPAFAGVRAAVLTPAHQYPTGVTLHAQRRLAATGWARAGERLVVEDDYDGEFRYDRQPVGALQGIAPDRVAYVGTASKTLGPALRLAWLVLPEWLLEPLVTAKRHADLHTESLGQLTLAEFIADHGYDRHVRACRLRYRRRRDLLLRRLRPQLGYGRRVEGVAAGLHALIRLSPDGAGEQRLLDAARARGLLLDGLGSHWYRPAGQPEGLVVGYGTPGESGYPAALDVLSRVLRESS